ncbi:integral membrane protein [Cladophialophora carrionii]|uniref:Integral membrane protein n=1 Tax=Cladophialophora carrionii TaxID=86049 RepID=A0A1C1CAP5_9EURO|nr:integral membrane protein [Cladophialophora carrionii]
MGQFRVDGDEDLPNMYVETRLLMPHDDLLLTKILQVWVDEIFYIVILMLTKVSILLFYMRIFPSRGFQILCNTMLAFVVLSGVVVLLCQLLQCLPVRFNWDKSIRGAKCINVNALTYGHAGINIFQDVLILALPIPWIMRLKLELNQKIGLVIMFQVGTFACVTAVVRLRFLAEFGGTNSTDPLWDNTDCTIWTAAETYSAIICSCLPAIRALYKTSRKGTTTDASSNRRSLTVLSARGAMAAVFSSSSKSRSSHQDPIEEHRLDLAEEWEQKYAAADRRHGPITITHKDLGSSAGGGGGGPRRAYMPDLKEEPDLETRHSEASSDHFASRTRPTSPHAY